MTVDEKGFEVALVHGLEKQHDRVGKLLVKKIQLLMEGSIGHPTKLSKSIRYELVRGGLNIISDTPIVKFIDTGTKPHIIRPKIPGGNLKFRTKQVAQGKNGHKFGFGDWVATKEVHHPGFIGHEFIQAALLLAKKEISEGLFAIPNL